MTDSIAYTHSQLDANPSLAAFLAFLDDLPKVKEHDRVLMPYFDPPFLSDHPRARESGNFAQWWIWMFCNKWRYIQMVEDSAKRAKTRPLDDPPIHPDQLFDPAHIGPPLPLCDPSLPYATSRHGQDYVVKRASGQGLTEAFNILLVQSLTTIPVPNIREVVVRQESSYMVMDYIEGETLAECWPRLSWHSRLRIVWTMRGYVSQLRQLRRSIPGPAVRTPSEGHFFGGCGAGPFASYQEMIDWFNHKLDVAQKKSRAPMDAPRWDCSWPLVFVHNDLNMRNILCGRDGRLYLLDWVWSGFYPEWFEYASMRHERRRQPRSWSFFNPLIAGFHQGMLSYLHYIQWALVVGFMM